jgi:hypothetical protein
MRGVSGDDPEGGAGSGVLRRRLVTARLGRQGPRPPGTTTWVRGARCTDPKATGRRCRTAGAEGDGSAAPRPKTATVERREASVPRHKRVHARLDALWDARRLARRLACRVMARPTGVPLSTRTSLGAPLPPRSGVSEAKVKNPGRKMRRGNEEVCVCLGS